MIWAALQKREDWSLSIAKWKGAQTNGQGSYDFRHKKESGIVIGQWYDNRTITIGPNKHSVNHVGSYQRYDRKQQSFVEVQRQPRESLQLKYGAERAYQLLLFLRNNLKMKKWYKTILFHLLDLAMANSWLLYCATNFVARYGSSSQAQDGNFLLHPQWCEANGRKLAFRLEAALETRRALRSCRLYMAPDAGVYEVDLHAKCQEKSRLKTYDVSKYLVKNDCAASGLPRQHPGRRWKLSTKCHLCICQQWWRHLQRYAWTAIAYPTYLLRSQRWWRKLSKRRATLNK